MKAIVFTGGWKQLENLGFRANCPDIDYFRSYYKGAGNLALRVLRNSREVVLNQYNPEVTAKICEFLIRNEFRFENPELCIVLEKQTKNLVNYDYYKHCPIGVYGYDCSNEELDEIFDNYDYYNLTEQAVRYIKELYDAKLLEIREFQMKRKKKK